ncbi:MAG: hypothetical protein RIC14_00185 [Filomicrobium sp.]
MAMISVELSDLHYPLPDGRLLANATDDCILEIDVDASGEWTVASAQFRSLGPDMEFGWGEPLDDDVTCKALNESIRSDNGWLAHVQEQIGFTDPPILHAPERPYEPIRL